MIENLGLIMETGAYIVAGILILGFSLLGLFAMFLLAGIRLPVPVRVTDNFYYRDRKIWGEPDAWIGLGLLGWLVTIVFVVPFILGLIGLAIGITPP